jgi:WD40 repeat protein
MGTVWMAQQQEPVKRLVAVKLIKPGMDSKQVLARFEAERQALALMDHPHIAKVHDAGVAPDGRPFFVMELVKGIPITQFCDDHRLTPRQRLELFVPVCHAVQHAHQKGVIHRDLKPSNVLVALYDDRSVPKVIDFGVAKAAGQALTEQTLHTGFGAVVGTVEYMSPEQATFNQLDVDTRSDVYSLGVVLYELLAGSPPFSKKELEAAGVLEILRRVREQEPSRPSTKLSTADGLPTLAANRGMEPARLQKLVRGELDWIVMKALEKDRSRRYETANAFALDVQRYLADEAVLACPPSAGYRLRKFARRNWAAVLTGTAILSVLVAGIAGTTFGLIRADHRRAEAEHAREDLTQRLYYQWVASAAHAREKHRAGEAEEFLDRCLPGLRDWEWHYLKRLPFVGVRRFGHGDIVNRVVWSTNGRLLASGSLNGWVKVWDTETEQLVFDRQAQKKFTRSLAFSPDGRLLATGGEDESVKVWNVETGEMVLQFPTGSRTTMLLALEFSPDGRLLAVADPDRRVWLRDLVGGGELPLSDDLVVTWGLAFTPDGGHLITVNTAGVVKVLGVPDGRAVATFQADIRTVGCRAAFTRDRRLLALGCEDGTVKVLKTDPLEEVRTLEAHVGEIAGIAFGAGDRRLATAGDDVAVKVWDVRTGQQALTLDIVSRRANGLAFSPDGHRLAVGSADGAVQVLDGTPLEGTGEAGELRTLEGHGHAVSGLVYSPDGGRIASASWDGTAKVWDARSGREVVAFHGHRAALTGVAWAPDGRRVATASWDGTARVWDAATATEVLPPLDAGAGPVYGLAFNPDGSVLATAHHDGSVRVWDAATGRPRAEIPHAHNQHVLGVAFSPGGEHLVSAGGKDNFVKVWDWQADTKGPVRALETVPPGIIRNPAYSPDGRQLVAVVANPARLWTWDTTTGEGKPLSLPSAWRVSQAVFRPSGGQLAVVSSGRVQFLDASGVEGPALVERHAGDIGCAAFSPDGRHLATGAGYKGRGEIRIWDATRWLKKR